MTVCIYVERGEVEDLEVGVWVNVTSDEAVADYDGEVLETRDGFVRGQRIELSDEEREAAVDEAAMVLS